jgi:hypothetical protein
LEKRLLRLFHINQQKGVFKMKRKMVLKAVFNKCIFLTIVLVMNLFFISCVGTIAYKEMNLTTDVRSQILNLRRYGGTDIDLIRQQENLMKRGFLNTNVEEYGYYIVNYDWELVNSDSGWMWFQAYTLYITSFLGVPTDHSEYFLKTIFRIYNSDGVQIKEYRKSDYITVTAGLYYGQNPTKPVAKKYNKLFREIFEMASVQSGEINQALRAAGPISQEKDSKAIASIASSISDNPLFTRTYSTPSYTYSSGSSSSNSSSSSTSSSNIGKEIADAFKSPLQSGTYSLVGSQEKISISSIAKSGVITQTSQGKTYQGTYNIDGNRMTVQIRGYTLVFNITSETSFSGNGETWVRTGF